MQSHLHKWYISLSRETRSLIGRFEFRKNCYLCGQIVAEKEKRGYDDWALAVLSQLMSFVRKTLYTTKPAIQILELERTYLLNNVSYSDGNRKRGRPKNILLEVAYVEICNSLKEKELEDEHVTLFELGSLMNEMVSESVKDIAYTTKYLKNDF